MADQNTNIPRNIPVKPRGRPFGPDHPGRAFQKGNPGRPKGVLNKATLASQALIDGKGERITEKCIELAEAGDTFCIKLVLERLVPPRKELPVEFTLPPLQTASDLTAAMAAVMQAVSEGKILLSQAVEFGKLLQLYGQTANALGSDELSTLTDEELRARILRKQSLAAVEVEWKDESKA